MFTMNRAYKLIGMLWVAVVITQVVLPLGNAGKEQGTPGQAELLHESKAELVVETREIVNQIILLEQKTGKTELAGYTIYPAAATQHLWELYKQARLRLDILNNGRVSQTMVLDGYLPSANPVENPYDTTQVRRAINDLKSNIPEHFLKNYRIFLAPLALSGVSGQGGVGFSIIYALPETFGATENDLRVTLYHELGHHIHLSYMPAQTVNGTSLWEEYHNFRGGSWQEPGKANTVEWGKSSEETFAEDFRMIFGSNQPYFGDMALGDPRNQPAMAAKFKKFVTGLAKVQSGETYQSPWIPVGTWFWLHQEWLIALMWLVLLGSAIYSRRRAVSAVNLRTTPTFNGAA